MKNRVLAAFLLTFAAGCTSAPAPTPEPAPEPEPDPEPQVVNTITMQWRVEGYAPEGMNTRVAGAELCLLAIEGFGCATSNESGELAIEGLNPGEAFGVRASHDGYLDDIYYSYLPPFGTPALSVLIPMDFAADVADRIGIAWPQPSHGVVQFSARDIGGRGMPDIVPIISAAEFEGPFFFDENGVADPTLNATTTNGGGFFTGLLPGDHEVTFPDCDTITFGWEGSAPNVALSPVEASARTSVAAMCFPKLETP